MASDLPPRGGMYRPFLFLMTCGLAALPAAAQPWHEARPPGFFGVGFSQPLNPIATRLDTGWNFTGGVGATNEYVGLLLDFTYNDFGINRTNLNRVGVREGSQRYWAVTLDPKVHVNQRGPVDFYVTGGGGLYSQITQFQSDFRDGNFGNGFGRNELISRNTIYKGGVDGGAGFAFNIGYSRAKIFAEARFHHMFTHGSGANFVPVTVGISW